MSKRSADDADATVPSKKVRRDGDATDSGSQPAGQVMKDTEGNVYLDLGNMKRATVSLFRGAAQVSIREYYTDQNGDVKPGKKGIILNRLQWDLLVAGTDAVTEKLKVVETEAVAGETSKKKKKSDEKTMKTKKEKPAQKKKKKKEVSEEEAGSDDE